LVQTVFTQLVGDGLGIEPVDDGILDREGEEVVAAGVVMPDEIAPPILLVVQAKALEILYMGDIHVKIREAVLLQEVDDLLIVTRSSLDQLGQYPTRVEQYHQKSLAVPSGEFFGLL